MFVPLIWAVVVLVALALWYAYAGSKDVFHPLMFIGPMLVFMYAWMPLQLDSIGGLAGFFQRDQLDFVQDRCLRGGLFRFRLFERRVQSAAGKKPEPKASHATLMLSAVILGCIGLGAWLLTVVHGSGGDLTGYRGGWDDSGYVRDASLLMFPAFLLILSAGLQEGIKIIHVSYCRVHCAVRH